MLRPSRERLVFGPHGAAAEGRELGNNHHRTTDHRGLPMKTTHIEQKRRVLIEKREKLIVRFNDAARACKGTARFETEIRRTNEFIASLDRIVEENARRPD